MLSKGVALCRGGGGEEGLGAGMLTGTETGALADEAGGDAVGAAGLAFTAGIAIGPGGVSDPFWKPWKARELGFWVHTRPTNARAPGHTPWPLPPHTHAPCMRSAQASAVSAGFCRVLRAAASACWALFKATYFFNSSISLTCSSLKRMRSCSSRSSSSKIASSSAFGSGAGGDGAAAAGFACAGSVAGGGCACFGGGGGAKYFTVGALAARSVGLDEASQT